jgi:hypothetical protein
MDARMLEAAWGEEFVLTRPTYTDGVPCAKGEPSPVRSERLLHSDAQVKGVTSRRTPLPFHLSNNR